MAENHTHSRYIYTPYYYDGHRLDPSDLDLAAYIDARIALIPGGSSYLSASVTLTDAQIKALPTTPIQIIAAPGAGKVIQYISGVLFFDWTADYTNINAASLIYFALHTDGNAVSQRIAESTGSVSALLAQGQSAISSPMSGSVNTLESVSMLNRNLYLFCENSDGDFTGGNASNTIKAIVYYVIVDL